MKLSVAFCWESDPGVKFITFKPATLSALVDSLRSVTSLHEKVVFAGISISVDIIFSNPFVRNLSRILSIKIEFYKRAAGLTPSFDALPLASLLARVFSELIKIPRSSIIFLASNASVGAMRHGVSVVLIFVTLISPTSIGFFSELYAMSIFLIPAVLVTRFLKPT
jgi:hypothetical protein